MSLALGPVARFRTRALYALLESRQAWCDVLLVTQEAGEELRFWVECLISLIHNQYGIAQQQ